MVDKLGTLKHRYEIDKSLSLPSEMRDLMRNIDDVSDVSLRHIFLIEI